MWIWFVDPFCRCARTIRPPLPEASLLFLLCLLGLSAHAQDNITPLRKQLAAAHADTSRSCIGYALGQQYEESDVDSCLYFLTQSLRAAQHSHDPQATAKAMYRLAPIRWLRRCGRSGRRAARNRPKNCIGNSGSIPFSIRTIRGRGFAKRFRASFLFAAPATRMGGPPGGALILPRPERSLSVSATSGWHSIFSRETAQWELYPDVAYGMEGDSPAFMGLIANGLNEPEHPDYGGWGGRYTFYTPALSNRSDGFRRPNWPTDEPETRPLWTNAADSLVSPQDKKGYRSIEATIWRWRLAFQHDFAARMDWCTKSYGEVNHPPVPALAHPERMTVKSGDQFHLNAAGTTDPDGDSMSYLWLQYPEAGTYPGLVSFRPYAANLYDLPVTAPSVDTPQTIHFILSVTDKGTPALTRYKRVVVQILPK